MVVCLSFGNSLPSSTLPAHLIPTPTYHAPPVNLRSIKLDSHLGHRKTRRRGISVVTRAGPPSTTSYIFAFVFPLSLLAVTIFTSVRVADKLDQKFFEEVVVEQATMEEEENEDEKSSNSSKRGAAPNRSRNRPKREVESSSV